MDQERGLVCVYENGDYVKLICRALEKYGFLTQGTSVSRMSISIVPNELEKTGENLLVFHFWNMTSAENINFLYELLKCRNDEYPDKTVVTVTARENAVVDELKTAIDKFSHLKIPTIERRNGFEKIVVEELIKLDEKN